MLRRLYIILKWLGNEDKTENVRKAMLKYEDLKKE